MQYIFKFIGLEVLSLLKLAAIAVWRWVVKFLYYFVPNQILIFLIQHWQTVLSCLIIVLTVSPFVFVVWKKKHLLSYSIIETGAAFISIALLLPWDIGIFDITSYQLVLTPIKLVSLFAGFYFAVRGIENLQKALNNKDIS